MTVKEAYIHIQQGLQNIAAFVNADIQLPELDYFFNQGVSKFVELAFPDEDDNKNPSKRNEKYAGIQATLDDLRVLEILGYNKNSGVGIFNDFTIGKNSGKSLSFPTNYRHLLNDRAVVIPLNCASTEAREVPNRLTQSDILPNILDSSYYKTDKESPISRLSGNILYVYNTYNNKVQFTIDNIYIDYIKKPDTVSYGVNGATVLQFPDHVCFKIIEVVLIYIEIVSEQNPQKIQQLLIS